ncbi:hypothetical protein [Agrobacterium tumefaciens]|uniref:hypothetical protein n=1 Tax=Agrobacterium tumefaciens TaxID=358 RepID=UPI001319D2DD|nr:hypothetical protein [Agrobacterium tumefaciens]
MSAKAEALTPVSLPSQKRAVNYFRLNYRLLLRFGFFTDIPISISSDEASPADLAATTRTGDDDDGLNSHLPVQGMQEPFRGSYGRPCSWLGVVLLQVMQSGETDKTAQQEVVLSAP